MATPYPQRFSLFPTDVNVISGNAMEPPLNAQTGVFPLGVDCQQIAPTHQGDSVSFSPPLDTGDYTLTIDALTGPDCGQVQLAIDGDNAGDPVDAYANPQGRANLSFPFTIASADRHVFTLTISGRTPAASTGFAFRWRRGVIVPSTDTQG